MPDDPRVTDDQLDEWMAYLRWLRDPYTCNVPGGFAENFGAVLDELLAERDRCSQLRGDRAEELEGRIRKQLQDNARVTELEKKVGSDRVKAAAALLNQECETSNRVADLERQAEHWRSFASDRKDDIVIAQAENDKLRRRIDAYRDAMRDIRRTIADLGITNPPPRLAALLEEEQQ